MSEERVKQAEAGAWIGLIGGVALALFKGSVGYAGNSKALMADAVHSLTDVARTLTTASVGRARKPMQEEAGHDRGASQLITTIVMSGILLVLGVEVALSSLKALYYGAVQAPSKLALIAIVISIVVKEALFQYKYRLGKKLGSSSLMTEAWGHRSDVLSSGAALVGVGGAVVGGSLGMSSLYYLDPLAGLLISGFVMRSSWRMAFELVQRNSEHELLQEEAVDLVETVQRIKGVIAVDDLRAREQGHYVYVDVRISVNPRITVQEGHEIARIVKQTLMKRFTHVSDVSIQVNPYDAGYPYKSQVSEQEEYPTLLH
jgi:cation diffusion facilitator family transporter